MFHFHPTEVQVLECSALAPDLAILPAGDKTQIGEQGVGICKYQHINMNLSRYLKIFVNTRPRAGLRPARPSGIVGRVHLLHVHFSRLALRLRRSALSNYARTTLCKTDLVMKKT